MLPPFSIWYNNTIGKPVDVDGVYGDQCVDIAESYCKYLWPQNNWVYELGLGNAKDLFNNANPDYFRKINYSPGLTAQQGDLIVYGATPTNPFGHIAAVNTADPNLATVIEQNGFNPTGVAYTATRNYNNAIGFLRPKGLNVDKITKEQEQSLSIMQTGALPGKNYDYRFTGKLLTQANLDQMLQFWSAQPRPVAVTLMPGIYQVK